MVGISPYFVALVTSSAQAPLWTKHTSAARLAPASQRLPLIFIERPRFEPRSVRPRADGGLDRGERFAKSGHSAAVSGPRRSKPTARLRFVDPERVEHVPLVEEALERPLDAVLIAEHLLG